MIALREMIVAQVADRAEVDTAGNAAEVSLNCLPLCFVFALPLINFCHAATQDRETEIRDNEVQT